MDYNIKVSSGQVLKGFIKSPGEKLRAVVIMIHGLGEHIHRYDLWSELFNGHNIGFTGVDLPGHGRSDGKRGHVKSEALLNEMIEILIRECRKTFPEKPLFLYGHSLGGVIVLNYLLKQNPQIRGAIVTSPGLKLAFAPGKAKLLLAAVMKGIMPGLIQPSGIPVEYLSHDSEVITKYTSDPLVHDKISLSLFNIMMNSAACSLSHAAELKIPLLLVHGGDDRICSTKGSIDFKEKTPLAELKIWEEGYHELHNEPFKKEVFDFIIRWINSKLT